MIKFTKMQALGNDFVVLDATRQSIAVNRDITRFLADRHRGVGCDQVLIIGKSTDAESDFTYRIFNADGSEVYQCGNGARCVGLYIHQEKLSTKKAIVLKTKSGRMRVAYCGDHDVQVDMAIPDFRPAALPFVTDQTAAPYQLLWMEKKLVFDVVSVGNPHCVMQQGSLSFEEMKAIGEMLNCHPAFPEGVNVGFVKSESRQSIHLTVYERGAGMTAACGSGACAAVAIGRKNQSLDSIVDVHQSGGSVQVTYQSLDVPIQLRGSATRVFEGILPNLGVDHFNK